MAAEILSYGLSRHECFPQKTWDQLSGGVRPAPGAKLRCDCDQVWVCRRSQSRLGPYGQMAWTKLGKAIWPAPRFHICDPGAAWKGANPEECLPGTTYLCRCGKGWEKTQGGWKRSLDDDI